MGSFAEDNIYMKFLSLSLIVTIAALSVTPSAYANPVVMRSVKQSGNQAASLVTQPATISGKWSDRTNQTNYLQLNTNSTISVLRDQGCVTNPLELIQNPALIFQQCQKQTNNPIPYTEQNEYFKVPKLDSGINVTVTKF